MYNPLTPLTIERISRAQGSTRPSSLDEQIKIRADAIARITERPDFPNKAESLAAQRVTLEMLLEEQKAERYAADPQARKQAEKISHGLNAIAYYESGEYPDELLEARRNQWLERVEKFFAEGGEQS